MTPPDTSALLVQIYLPDDGWLDVGLLQHANETSWFESWQSYWDLPRRPVLGQVFDERGPAWRPSARVALPTWFSHLLPEGRLRRAVAEAAAVNEEREFFLLSRIGGDDLPGAVRVTQRTATLDEAPDATDEVLSADHDDLGPLKFSLAGVQLKFSVTESERGLTVPARGAAGTWIAKLPDRRPGFESVPEAEFAGLELARSSGIAVPECRLVSVGSIGRLPGWALEGGGQALLVRRFDRRTGEGRVHVEELAQVLDVPTGQETFKYRRVNFETVARVTAALCGVDSVGEVIDRLVLNVLLGNGDAHAKNWAYCYPDGHTPELSPAYDIVPTVLYVANDDLGLNLGRSRSFDDVRPDSFARLADKAGWDGADGRRRAEEAVARVLSAWPILGELLPRRSVSFLTRRRDELALVRI